MRRISRLLRFYDETSAGHFCLSEKLALNSSLSICTLSCTREGSTAHTPARRLLGVQFVFLCSKFKHAEREGALVRESQEDLKSQTLCKPDMPTKQRPLDFRFLSAKW